MNPFKFSILAPPAPLQHDVECFRLAEYGSDQVRAVNVCLNGTPGIVFQHHEGRSPIEAIVTASRRSAHIPTLYLYGQVTEPSVMHHRPGPYTMVQAILKPHALKTLFGLNAAALTNRSVELDEFGARDLNAQLIEAHSQQERLDRLADFLAARLAQAQLCDGLVEESLRYIHRNIATVTVGHILAHVHLSERQLERRFGHTVGVSPQFYIRVRRFNEAIRLMKSGQYRRLTDIAHGLNFYDQSHFIRDFKAFSGLTPKGLAQTEGGFLHGQAGYAYL